MKTQQALKVEQVSKCFFIAPEGSRSLKKSLQDLLQFKFSKKKPFLALDKVSFSVKRGEVLGIIGPNGSGKSTLLKLLSKITSPTAGRIEITGKVNTLLEVGTGFHPELTGKENIYLNGSILGMSNSEIRSKFEEIVAFAEIGQFLHTPVKHYSSGMYVRLAFSVAAHLNPDILIIDEVLSVGDAAFQEKCLEKMEQEIIEGCTVLFVSHNLDAVEKLCSRVILLEKGKIVKQGLPTEVIPFYLERIAISRPEGFKAASHPAGSGAFRFTDLKVLDDQNKPIEQISSGQNVQFHISYSSNQPTLTAINIRLVIKATTGIFHLACISRVQLDYARKIPGQGILICTVKKIPLNVGRYTVELEGRQEGQLADLVPEAMQLEIIRGPFYKSGNLPSYRFHMLADYDWRVQSEH